MNNLWTRRHFIRSLAGNAVAVSAVSPWIVPSSALGLEGKMAPSERITMGVIGCGIHADWNIRLMFRNREQQIVALCDVDEQHLLAKKKMVEGFYSKDFGRSFSVDVYNDFRDLVRRKDLDAVAVITPDHWHVLLAVFAMKSGKHLICEKPVLTIEEGKILRDVQKQTGMVYLTASQNRTLDISQHLVNVVRNGLLGKLCHIQVSLPIGNNRGRVRNPHDFLPGEIPSTLDYEKWSGPAPLLPYIPARLHNTWRYHLSYSGGVLPDWGAHYINLAMWANDSDTTPAREYWGNRDNPQTHWEYPDESNTWTTTGTFDFTARFSNDVTMRVWSETPSIRLEGEKGWIQAKGPSLYDSHLTASHEDLLTWRPGTGDLDVGKDLKYCTVGKTFCKPQEIKGGEHLHLTHCIKNNLPTYYTAEMGYATDVIAHAGGIVMKYLDGGKLCWNSTTESFEGENAEIAHKAIFYARKQREPWTFAHVDSWID